MKIGFFNLEGWEQEFIKSSFPDDELFFSIKNLDKDNIPEQRDFDIVSVFVDSLLDKETLSHFPNLKFIATRSTGFDHIDLDYCKENNILVANVPAYGDNTVAEFTFGLILSLLRKVYYSIDRIKETGNFDFSQLRGEDLKGKTIGIVGTGRIGREVAKIANGFSMQILAYDPYPNEEFARELNFTYLPFNELIEKSDIITFHCPLTESSKHILNKDNIFNVKKGAYIINTARGGLIETEALVSALQKGHLKGCALDVLEDEHELKNETPLLVDGKIKDVEKIKNMLYDHILMELPNVLITPHNAFNSKEALQRILNTTIENVKNYKEERINNINLVQK